MAWSFKIQQLLGDVEVAGAARTQGDQRQRVELSQAHVLRDLELADVVLVVGQLHPFEVEEQLLAGQEPLVPRKVGAAQEGEVRVADLVLKDPLRLGGNLGGEGEGAPVEGPQVTLEPSIQSVVG